MKKKKTDEEILLKKKEKNAREYASLLADPDRLARKRAYQKQWAYDHRKITKSSVTVYFDIDVKAKLIDIAKTNQKSTSELAAEIILDYINSHPLDS